MSENRRPPMGKYLAVENERGYGVVIDHNGRSIAGIDEAADGSFTPCFDAAMASRIARLLNEYPFDPVGSDVLDDMTSDALRVAKPAGNG